GPESLLLGGGLPLRLQAWRTAFRRLYTARLPRKDHTVIRRSIRIQKQFKAKLQNIAIKLIRTDNQNTKSMSGTISQIVPYSFVSKSMTMAIRKTEKAPLLINRDLGATLSAGDVNLRNLRSAKT